MTSWSKELLLEFIRIYKEEECLWKVKSDTYRDKQKREKSYQRLLFKVKDHIPNVNRDDILKKIKNLRTVFRKESKQVKDSMRPGAYLDTVYSPRLWYYKELEFLTDQEECRLSVSTLSQEKSAGLQDDTDSKHLFGPEIQIDVDESYEHPNSIVVNDNPGANNSIAQCDVKHANPCVNTTSLTRSTRTSVAAECPTPNTCETSSHVTSRRLSNKRKAPEDETCDKLITIPQTDVFDSYGQFVAKSLKQMNGEQTVHALKLISDIIYEGNLGVLSRHSRLLSAPNEIPSISGFYRNDSAQ